MVVFDLLYCYKTIAVTIISFKFTGFFRQKTRVEQTGFGNTKMPYFF